MANDDFPRIISHYRLDRLLGSGAMGAVYEAIDRRDDTRVAIKLLHVHLLDDDTFRQRFEREAHVGALLRSPYTVHLLDYGVADGAYFLALEYVDGLNLKQLCAGAALPPKRALNVIRQAARALEEAEARRVVHRDIKPENVLVHGDDSVKVSDFGIARQSGAATLTAVGAFVGTLSYASPEQQYGQEDHRSDIYSLGATLYYTLTGRAPFEGSTVEMLRHHRETPVPLEPLAGLPQVVTDIVSRCLEKSPDDRYQSAADLASDLERALAALPAMGEEPTKIVEAETEELQGGLEKTEAMPKGTQQQTSLAPAPLQLSLTKARGGGLFSAEATYSLVITNPGGEAQQAALTHEIANNCVCMLPASASVPAGGQTTVMLKVKPRNRRWTGVRRSYQFSISASGGGGSGPPVTVSGSFEESPLPPMVPIGGGLLAVGAVLALVAAGAIFGGEEDDPKMTASPGPSRTERPTATFFLTDEPTTPAPPGGPPANSIQAGEWFFSFTITDNTCSFGLFPGDAVDTSILLLETTFDDGFVSDGEVIDAQNSDGSPIGTYVFSYPLFEFSANIIDNPNGDFVFYSLFFDGPDSGLGFAEEHYLEDDGTPCVITLQEF